MLTMYELQDVLKIGIELTTEKNKNHLLEKMLGKAMEISGCDAGTLYLCGEQISLDTRILVVVDIYDAMTCTDRPYKKPIPRGRALSILDDMVEEGKIDGTVVEALREVLADVSEGDVERMATELR